MSSGPFISRVPPRSALRPPGQSPDKLPAEAGKPFIQVLGEGTRPRPPAAPVLPANAPREAITRPPPVGRSTALPTAIPAKLEDQAGLRSLAARALDAERRVDELMASAGRSGTFSAAELIALQATVFRYSQTVEIISRAADRLVGAIKQTISTQV